MAKDYNDSDGRWVTISGRKVFIAEGQSLGDAMKKSGKFGKVSKVKGSRKNTFKDEISQGDKNKFAMGYGLSKDAVKGYAKARQDEREKNDKVEVPGFKNYEYNKKTGEVKSKDYSEKEAQNRVKDVESRNKENYYGTKDKIKQDVLEQFGEDFGYDNNNYEENLKSQIDYMRNPGESIHKTAERFVEGGGFLIYNDDIKDYLKENGVKFNDDNFFDKYKQTMADKMVEVYNGDSKSESSLDEDDLSKVKRIQNDLSKKDNLTKEEKEWKDQLSNTQKRLEKGDSRENIIKDLDAQASISLNKSPREIKEADERYNSPQGYSKDEQDILDRFSEDYGYDKGDNLKNLKGQIDYMRNPGDSIHRTAERLVEGGDFLIYNGDIKDYLDERGIKYNEDNFFDKYKQDMANKIEKLYNSKEQNGILNDDDIVNDDRKGFEYSFRTNKRDMFNVRYNRTGSNQNMDFATSADRFNRNRTDWEMGGQAQKEILQEGSKARKFFDKWDNKHLSKLTQKEYNELQNDIEELKKEYAYIEGSNFNDKVKLDREYKSPKKTTNDAMNDTIRNKSSKTKADRNIDAFDDDNKKELQRRLNAKYDYNTPGKIGNMKTEDFVKQRNEFNAKADKLWNDNKVDSKQKKISDDAKSGKISKQEAYKRIFNLHDDNFKQLNQISKNYDDEVVASKKPMYSERSNVIKRAMARMSDENKAKTRDAREELRKELNESGFGKSIKNAVKENKMFKEWQRYRKSHPNSDISLTSFKQKYKG